MYSYINNSSTYRMLKGNYVCLGLENPYNDNNRVINDASINKPNKARSLLNCTNMYFQGWKIEKTFSNSN